MKTKITSKIILGALFGISFLAQPTLAQVPGAGGQANSAPVPRVAQPIVNTYAQFTGGGGGHGGGGGYGGGFGFAVSASLIFLSFCCVCCFCCCCCY